LRVLEHLDHDDFVKNTNEYENKMQILKLMREHYDKYAMPKKKSIIPTGHSGIQNIYNQSIPDPNNDNQLTDARELLFRSVPNALTDPKLRQYIESIEYQLYGNVRGIAITDSERKKILNNMDKQIQKANNFKDYKNRLMQNNYDMEKAASEINRLEKMVTTERDFVFQNDLVNSDAMSATKTVALHQGQADRKISTPVSEKKTDLYAKQHYRAGYQYTQTIDDLDDNVLEHKSHSNSYNEERIQHLSDKSPVVKNDAHSFTTHGVKVTIHPRTAPNYHLYDGVGVDDLAFEHDTTVFGTTSDRAISDLLRTRYTNEFNNYHDKKVIYKNKVAAGTATAADHQEWESFKEANRKERQKILTKITGILDKTADLDNFGYTDGAVLKEARANITRKLDNVANAQHGLARTPNQARIDREDKVKADDEARLAAEEKLRARLERRLNVKPRVIYTHSSDNIWDETEKEDPAKKDVEFRSTDIGMTKIEGFRNKQNKFIIMKPINVIGEESITTITNEVEHDYRRGGVDKTILPLPHVFSKIPDSLLTGQAKGFRYQDMEFELVNDESNHFTKGPMCTYEDDVLQADIDKYKLLVQKINQAQRDIKTFMDDDDAIDNMAEIRLNRDNCQTLLIEQQQLLDDLLAGGINVPADVLTTYEDMFNQIDEIEQRTKRLDHAKAFNRLQDRFVNLMGAGVNIDNTDDNRLIELTINRDNALLHLQKLIAKEKDPELRKAYELEEKNLISTIGTLLSVDKTPLSEMASYTFDHAKHQLLADKGIDLDSIELILERAHDL
jgi:hypothetical protein